MLLISGPIRYRWLSGPRWNRWGNLRCRLRPHRKRNVVTEARWCVADGLARRPRSCTAWSIRANDDNDDNTNDDNVGTKHDLGDLNTIPLQLSRSNFYAKFNVTKYSRFAIRIRLICFNLTRVFREIYRAIDSALSRFIEIKCQCQMSPSSMCPSNDYIYYEYIVN